MFFFLFFLNFQDIVRRGRGPPAEVGCHLHETCSSRESGCKPMLADVMNRGREEWFAKKGKKNRDLGEKRRENRGKKKGELTRSGVSNQTSPEVSSPL